ncbi:hypothetical protein [Aureimonas sp. AU40]|uniref:hypothetical protein n=1 Tax=Aureimonas sp. AU40 TaxID=1637747 RepID=UPI0012E39288|nr:hypothetical protein [Aureimonas sp. AU40]
MGTWDGTKHYLKHYANSLYLAFIAKSTKDGAERRQAESELAIAERKMAYWRRHPNYVQADALKGIADLKKQWNLA